jgi:hypothetical protein
MTIEPRPNIQKAEFRNDWCGYCNGGSGQCADCGERYDERGPSRCLVIPPAMVPMCAYCFEYLLQITGFFDHDHGGGGDDDDLDLDPDDGSSLGERIDQWLRSQRREHVHA